jgi:Xaa-Pro aminopeptidase
MKVKRILKAAFTKRNLALLAVVAIVSYWTEYLPFALVGAAGYLFFVLQTLKSIPRDGSETSEEKLESLLELDSRCDELYREVRGELDRPSQKKVEDILQDKNELMELFRNHQENYVGQRVTEQALKLVMAYTYLAVQYNQKRDAVVSGNAGEIIDDINSNVRKMNSLKDPQAIEDMKRAIEMEKKVLDRIEEDERELEKMAARLAYIESTMKTFKHQLQYSENTADTSAEIDSIINEAAALDQALNERRDRLKL